MEQRDLKEQFGQLGLHLLDDAEEKVRTINEKTLLQKASLKKDFLNRVEDRTTKIKNEFIEKYNKFLSNSLSSTILQSKEMLLQIKNDLLLDFKNHLMDKIKLLIENNYSNYIAFFINKLHEIILDVGSEPSGVEISLNSNDFKYFQGNRNKIEAVFSGKVIMKELKQPIIGGFILYLTQGKISYDYSVENIISKASNVIEQIGSEPKKNKTK